MYLRQTSVTELNRLTGRLPLSNDLTYELTALTEPIYQTDCLIRKIPERYRYRSDLNRPNRTEDPSRTMARPNDIPVPGSQPYTGKEPERTERTEPNRRSSIMIDGDNEDDEPNRHEVTFEDFLNYVHEKPEWLYGKLRMIHERFEDVIEDREARLAESELSGQAKDGEIVLMKNRLDETTERLNQMTLDRDAYANKIAYDTLHPVDHTTAGG